MSENSAPNSALVNFSPVPRRAFSDRRMKARHLKVLGAICVAVDAPTGTALISQERVAHHAGIARQKIGAVIADLEQLGYIAPIRRGRTQRGRFKTIVYRVLYDQSGASCSEPDEHHVTPVGDMDRVTPGGDSTVSPPGVTEPDFPSSDLSSSARPSGSREGVDQRSDDRTVEAKKNARQGDRRGGGSRAQGHMLLPIAGEYQKPTNQRSEPDWKGWANWLQSAQGINSEQSWEWLSDEMDGIAAARGIDLTEAGAVLDRELKRRRKRAA